MVPGKPNGHNHPARLFEGQFSKRSANIHCQVCFQKLWMAKRFLFSFQRALITNASGRHQNRHEFETFVQIWYRRKLHIFRFLLITHLPYIHFSVLFLSIPFHQPFWFPWAFLPHTLICYKYIYKWKKKQVPFLYDLLRLSSVNIINFNQSIHQSVNNLICRPCWSTGPSGSLLIRNTRYFKIKYI